MSATGFGKQPQALRNKGKRKKAKGGKLESYTMGCFTSDGVFRVVEVEAPSVEQAIKKFEFCIEVLERCLRNATHEEIFGQGEVE